MQNLPIRFAEYREQSKEKGIEDHNRYQRTPLYDD